MEATETITVKDFISDILTGLSAKPKSLPSGYFYDTKDSQIFQQIMQMPRYYLTDCEFEIFNLQKQQILEAINPQEKFNLIELEAGGGFKAKVLLRYFQLQQVDFEYFLVDISKL